MKVWKIAIMMVLVASFMIISVTSSVGLITWILPNSTSTATLAIGGTINLTVNQSNVNGAANATNMSFYWKNATGGYNLIGTNVSLAPVGDSGQGRVNATWTFNWNTITLGPSDAEGSYTLLASATNNTTQIIENQTITLVEIDNTLPIVSVDNAEGTKVLKSGTITCTATNTRSVTRIEFGTSGTDGPYPNQYTSSTIPAVTYASDKVTFTPNLGDPPEGSVYARCVVSDGTNSTTSSAVNLIIDQQKSSSGTAVGVEIGTQVAQQQQKNNTLRNVGIGFIAVAVGYMFLRGKKK